MEHPLDDDNGDDLSSSNHLDHALLESLFYNEMMMLGGDDLLTEDDTMTMASSSSVAAMDVTAATPRSPAAATTTHTPSTPDVSALAERAMLHDFGVPAAALSPTAATATPATTTTRTATMTSNNHHSQQQQQEQEAPSPLLSSSLPQVTAVATAAAAAAAVPPASHWQTASSLPPVPTTVAAGGASENSHERAQRLVAQFATLASRLGISLPPNVLQSLTATAALKEAQAPPTAASTTINAPPSSSNMAPTTLAAVSSSSPPPATTPTTTTTAPSSSRVAQLQSTAEAAIQAVEETRKRPPPPAAAADPSKPEDKKLSYSKRRKKPRLGECEQKLALLREENDMLKRHLDAVTNRSTQLEKERKAYQEEMRRLVRETNDHDTQQQKLQPLLAKFSEMYSDYGKHRHDELTFHLGRLEKMAAPTNFTKMGLWTLGQNEGFYKDEKRNPIAGILRKELGITPVQGRKILEQRQKIKRVCSNLKQCLELLGKLQKLCEHKQQIFSNRMSKCQEILTPLQVVKLLLWVDEHSHLIQNVCPGWGSEQIRPKQSEQPAPPAAAPSQPEL